MQALAQIFFEGLEGEPWGLTSADYNQRATWIAMIWTKGQ